MEKIKVVLVDDNVNLVDMVKEYFKTSEVIEIVNCAYDGCDGIELISKEEDNFDVLVLDLIMPKKDGLYVLNEMKKRGIYKSTIVATSYNATNVIREVAELGVNYFILKPFELA